MSAEWDEFLRQGRVSGGVRVAWHDKTCAPNLMLGPFDQVLYGFGILGAWLQRALISLFLPALSSGT